MLCSRQFFASEACGNEENYTERYEIHSNNKVERVATTFFAVFILDG